MLLAREAVNLDRSPQTEGTLLATLLRSPAVVGTFALPINVPPQRLALTPDGHTLAVGDSTGDIRFYDPRTHAVQRPPVTDFSGGLSPVYSSDGSLLLYPSPSLFVYATTGGEVPSIAVRDAHTLALIHTLAFDPFVAAKQTLDIANASVLIAPDGRTVYCAYSVLDAAGNPAAGYLDRWALPSGRRVSTRRIGSGALLAARLIDAGKRLIVVRARDVSVFDARSLRRLRSVESTPTGSPPTAAAISPDGRTIVIGSQTGLVSFIDVSTGIARPGVDGHGALVANVVYSPDGRTVATTGDDDKLILWNPKTAAPVGVFNGPAAQPRGAALSADGKTLYTSSHDGVLLEWDLGGDRRFGRRFQLGAGLGCCGPVSPLAPPLALSPDGSTFAVRLGASSVGLFSARTLQRQASFTVKPNGAAITALAWSPTGPELAVGGYSGLVQMWNVAGAPRLVRSLVGLHPLIGLPEAIQALAFSPDGRLLAASDNNIARSGPGELSGSDTRLPLLAIWQASTGKLRAPLRDLGTGNPSGSDVLAFSRDGKLLAVSLLDGSDRVFDASTDRTRQTLPPFGAEHTVALAFAPSGTLATGTTGGIVQLWNPVTGDQIGHTLAAAAAPVTSIAFDPTGQRFATSGGQDGTIKLWFTSTLQQEGTTLDTDQGATSTAAFEPGGRSLLVIDDHGNGFTWPTSLAALERRACAVASRNLTREEWTRYLTGRSYTSVCP